MLLLALLLLAVAALAVRLAPAVAEIRRVRRMTADIPGPKGYPVIGNALALSCSLDEFYDRCRELASQFTGVMRLTLGHITVVVLNDPDDLEVVMTSEKTSHKSVLYSHLPDTIGNGIVTLNGAEWRRHRKAISPSLHLDILHDFVDVFHAQGVAFADSLGAYADSGEVVNVTPLCGVCANSTILSTVMCSDAVDADDEEKQRYVDAVHKAMEHFMYRCCRPWLLSDWAYSLLRTRYADYRQVIETLTRLPQKIIREKKRALEDGSAAAGQQRKRQAFLDHVLASAEGAVLSEEELVAEVRTFVFVASLSSMDTLSFIIYALAIRQDIQDRVRQEVDDVLGEDRGRCVRHSDLPHLQYTERFIKEVLRYFCLLPLYGRKVLEDLTLPSGYTLPRGCQTYLFLPSVHRDPKCFPEPDKFDPDRFLPENTRGRHPFAYLPFSAGSRNCLGQRYAMMFMKTVTAALVSRLRVEIPDGGPQRVDDVPMTIALSMTVKGGANIRVRRR